VDVCRSCSVSFRSGTYTAHLFTFCSPTATRDRPGQLRKHSHPGYVARFATRQKHTQSNTPAPSLLYTAVITKYSKIFFRFLKKQISHLFCRHRAQKKLSVSHVSQVPGTGRRPGPMYPRCRGPAGGRVPSMGPGRRPGPMCPKCRGPAEGRVPCLPDAGDRPEAGYPCRGPGRRPGTRDLGKPHMCPLG